MTLALKFELYFSKTWMLVLAFAPEEIGISYFMSHFTIIDLVTITLSFASHLLNVAIYTPSTNKFVGGILVSPCLSICMSVEKCTITPFPFDKQWSYFTHVLPMSGGRPLLILGSKGQRSKLYFEVCIVSTYYNNFISFWHELMILNTCVDHDPRRTSTDFGVNTSKVKVIFGLWTFYSFRTITQFPFCIHLWYFTYVLSMTRGWHLLILVLTKGGSMYLSLL